MTKTSPGGTPGDGLPIGLDFRVPTTVVSPWTVGGRVCSDVFDHTSLIRLIESRFGVTEPHLSAWRRQTCGDLTSVLRLSGQPARWPSKAALQPASADAELLTAQLEVDNNPAPVPPKVNQAFPPSSR